MRRTFSTSLWFAGLTAATANAEILWMQPAADSFGGLSSQDARNPGGLGWFSEVADNFVAQPGWSVDEVEFYGGYATPLGQEGRVHDSLLHRQRRASRRANIRTRRIRIYRDELIHLPRT